MKQLYFLKPILHKKQNFFIPIINNLAVSIPVVAFENIFTNIHYGHSITNLNVATLQMLIVLYTYGTDRFKDTLDEYKKDDEKDSQKNKEIFNKYKSEYSYFFNILLGIIIYQFIKIKDSYPFLILLLSTNFYRDLKKNIPIIKPFYVSFMWTLICFILPCFVYEHNYNILNYPIEYMPLFLNIFASSNFLDTKDADEDLKNNIITIPNKFGELNSNYLSMFLLIISSVIFTFNHNINDYKFQSLFFESYNIILFFLVKNDLMKN